MAVVRSCGRRMLSHLPIPIPTPRSSQSVSFPFTRRSTWLKPFYQRKHSNATKSAVSASLGAATTSLVTVLGLILARIARSNPLEHFSSPKKRHVMLEGPSLMKRPVSGQNGPPNLMNLVMTDTEGSFHDECTTEVAHRPWPEPSLSGG